MPPWLDPVSSPELALLLGCSVESSVGEWTVEASPWEVGRATASDVAHPVGGTVGRSLGHPTWTLSLLALLDWWGGLAVNLHWDCPPRNPIHPEKPQHDLICADRGNAKGSNERRYDAG
jgi:hypothetical protein